MIDSTYCRHSVTICAADAEYVRAGNRRRGRREGEAAAARRFREHEPRQSHTRTLVATELVHLWEDEESARTLAVLDSDG